MATEEKQISRSVCNHAITVHENITLEELEHIVSCDICAAEYANVVEQYAMIKAPHYLKDNILQKSRAFSEIRETNKIYKTQLYWKNLQLFRYSMKIGLAMCGALAILFLTPIANTPRGEPSGMVYFLDKINSELREFSDNMVEYTDLLVSNSSNNKEDMKHDK